MNNYTPSPIDRLWMLGTYRRMDVLDVPAFHRDVSDLQPQKYSRRARLCLLPTFLPREISSLSDWLAGNHSDKVERLTWVERLSLLLRFLASPMRFEPQNIYRIHRAVPSGRCLFPVDIMLFLPNSLGEMAAFLYHPNFHAIEALPPSDCSELAATSQGVIAGVARCWMIANKYGDFTPFPIMLESGMLRSQLRLLRDAVGWGGAQHDREIARPYCDGLLDFPVFAETIQALPHAVDALPTRDVVLAVWNETPHDRCERPQLAELIAAFDQPGGAEETPPAPPNCKSAAGTHGLLDVLRLRNSGNDRHGMFPAPAEATPNLLDRLIKLSAAFRARRAGTTIEQRLEIKFVWLACTGARSGIYDRYGRLFQSIDRLHLLSAAARSISLPLRYNFAAHQLMVLIAADPLDELIRAPGGARDVHLGAGALAQDITLAAAALGLFARPVRMLSEVVLESALPIDGQLVYTLLCGAARSTNLTAELL